MPKFGILYQQHKYTDQSDNPPLLTWQIKADTPEEPFRLAQIHALKERKRGRNIGHVRREMRDESGNIIVADGNYILTPMDYQERVLKLENEGLCTSDAQAVVDAEIERQLNGGS